MLTVNADVVCRLIDLAHQYHAQEGLVIPDEMEVPVDNTDGLVDDISGAQSVSAEDSPADDSARQLLAGHGDETSFLEFKTIIDAMDPDQQQEVVAMLWLGRGDYAMDEWDSVLEQARDQWTPDTADYLLGHPLLSSYLQDGLESHGYSCSD